MLCTVKDFIVFGYINIVSFITHYKEHFLFFFLLAVNWSRVFQYRVGSGGVLQQNRVTGELRSGRNAEIFDRVFQGTLFALGYFMVCQIFLGSISDVVTTIPVA